MTSSRESFDFEDKIMLETIHPTILYGSETGTAQDVAEEIWKSAKRFGLKCCVRSMDDYDIQGILSESLMIFVVATTGQGDCPSNMKKFWRFLLKKNHPDNLLDNLKYAVLGLGDSSYEKYNFAAKKLNKRLGQLQGKEITPIGLADDQHDLGIDATIEPWIQKLWKAVEESFNISLKISSNQPEMIQRFDVKILSSNSSNTKNQTRDIWLREIETNQEKKIGKIIENNRTTSRDHFQDVRLIKFQVENLDYSPGDLVYLRPKNSPEQVQSFFDLLQEFQIALSPETILKISEKEINVPVCLKSSSLTLREVVEQYWDLNYKPRRSAMKILSSISDDELEREKLLEFSSSTGQDDLYNYVNRPRRNIIEVLRDFPHTAVNLNAQILFEIMAPIKPRAFSIASSNRATKNEIHLLVAVVRYKTKLVKPRLGLCSNWLASLEPGDKFVYWMQKGSFKFNLDRPMILIGPGTGVAVFRSLLLDRAAKNHSLDKTCMIFGCRFKNKDFHCQREFDKLEKENNLKVFCAFSRDQENKCYVQDVVKSEGKLCWEYLQSDGQIYLSGSSKNMPKCVRDEFIELSMKYGNLKKSEAENYIEKMEKSGRYQTETWG